MSNYQQKFDAHIEKEMAAVSLLNSVGTLLYTKSVELVLYRNHLVNTNVYEVMRLHDYTNSVALKQIDVFTSAKLAKLLIELDICPAKIDIGKLAYEFLNENKAGLSEEEFLKEILKDMIGKNGEEKKPVDVILYGFGRIGRLVARELIHQAGKGQQLRLRTIVTRKVTADILTKRAALIKNDSVHGAFEGTVEVDTVNMFIILNGQRVKMIEAKNPEDTDYTSYGINDALVIDSTGVFKDKEALSRHLKAKGTKKVLLTAPGTGIPNIVYGINQKELNFDEHKIVSAASCTTNAISPILKVVNDTYGVVKGHLETIHAYTNDQNLLDNMHSKPRRGRSAAINMVLTSTGAGKAVTKVIPSMEGKLTANAVRVPTPNGSIAILNLELEKKVSLDEINNTIRKAALVGPLVNQIYYSVDPEMVSNDIIGNNCASIFDSHCTKVSTDKKNVVLYSWYDNEFGYTKQVLRLAKYLANVRRKHYY